MAESAPPPTPPIELRLSNAYTLPHVIIDAILADPARGWLYALLWRADEGVHVRLSCVRFPLDGPYSLTHARVLRLHETRVPQRAHACSLRFGAAGELWAVLFPQDNEVTHRFFYIPEDFSHSQAWSWDKAMNYTIFAGVRNGTGGQRDLILFTPSRLATIVTVFMKQSDADRDNDAAVEAASAAAEATAGQSAATSDSNEGEEGGAKETIENVAPQKRRKRIKPRAAGTVSRAEMVHGLDQFAVATNEQLDVTQDEPGALSSYFRSYARYVLKEKDSVSAKQYYYEHRCFRLIENHYEAEGRHCRTTPSPAEMVPQEGQEAYREFTTESEFLFGFVHGPIMVVPSPVRAAAIPNMKQDVGPEFFAYWYPQGVTCHDARRALLIHADEYCADPEARDPALPCAVWGGAAHVDTLALTWHSGEVVAVAQVTVNSEAERVGMFERMQAAHTAQQQLVGDDEVAMEPLAPGTRFIPCASDFTCLTTQIGLLWLRPPGQWRAAEHVRVGDEEFKRCVRAVLSLCIKDREREWGTLPSELLEQVIQEVWAAHQSGHVLGAAVRAPFDRRIRQPHNIRVV